MSTSPSFNTGDFAYGTWRLLNTSPSDADVLRRMEVCLESGITTVDTAEIYGKYQVEAALGRALSGAPELKQSLQFVTKAGINVASEEKPHARLPHYDASAKNLVHAAEKSLRLLQLDVIELFLVHRPDWPTHPEDTAAGLDQLLQSGKIRHAGVSNYSIHQFDALDRLLGGRLVTNQIEFSPFQMEALDNGVFEQCLARKIRPMAWSPLGKGVLFDPENATAGSLRTFLAEVSPRYGGASPDVLVYAWILSHWARPTVILGTNQEERIRSAVAASGLTLDHQDWYTVWQIVRGRSVP